MVMLWWIVIVGSLLTPKKHQVALLQKPGAISNGGIDREGTSLQKGQFTIERPQNSPLCHHLSPSDGTKRRKTWAKFASRPWPH
jgi:hypothetical protein